MPDFNVGKIDLIQAFLPYLISLIILALIIILISAWYIHRKKTRATRLKKKSEKIDRKIERLQKDYFVRKKISRPEFEGKYEEYKKELIAIGKKIRSIATKRKNKHKKEEQKTNS